MPDTQDMVVVHRLFRRELSLLPRLVEAVPSGDLRRARRIAAHADLVLAFLDNHRLGEDELLWPLLIERAHLDHILLRRMEAQHARLAASLTRIRTTMGSWRGLADPQGGQLLAGQFEQAAAVLLEHLDEEERFILPLARRHLTLAEWARLADHGQAATPTNPIAALTLLGLILEDATPDEQRQFLAPLPVPVRMIWRSAGRFTYQRHVTRLRAAPRRS